MLFPRIGFLSVLVFLLSAQLQISSASNDGDDDGPCILNTNNGEKNVKHEKYTEEAQKKEVIGQEGRKEKKKPELERLIRLDGVKVGHEQYVDVGAGKTVKLITKSLKPLLFVIPNFLSSDEAKNIIAKANDTGMFSSLAKGGLTPKDTFVPSKVPGKSLGAAGYFDNWDKNLDDKIDLEEVIGFVNFYHFVTFTKADVEEMFRRVKVDCFDDESIDRLEFDVLDTQGLEDYINIVLREHPRFRQRFSEQTWLPMFKSFDPTLHKIRERVGRLTKLPRRILYGGEHLQVLKYTPHGHYHAHHDSETHTRTDVPCCHQTDTETVQAYGKCKLCRFITVLFYLNTVEEGGETAFPAADNLTYAEKEMRRRTDKRADDYFNLSEHCYDANLVVGPVEGTAVMWYNHHVDEATGWLGDMDLFSLHGGCDVKKGEKWLSNMWLPAPYNSDKHINSMYFNALDFEEDSKGIEL